MVSKQDKIAALPGVLATLSAGFELTTRYLWLIVLPALLDLFLWIGPRLSFRPLIDALAAQMAGQTLLMDPVPLLELYGSRINYFTYLSVSLVGVPALMTGLTPERTPIQPLIIERAGWGEWFGVLALFTAAGLLLAAIYYSLIAFALRRSGVSGGNAALAPFRFARRAGHIWLRLLGLAALFVALTLLIMLPVSLVAAFLALISQTLATIVLLGALVLLIWIAMFFGYAPQGMVLNPRGFLPALGESLRLFRANLPASLGLLFVVMLVRRLLSYILLTADSGTWVTAINLLAHAYISTALIVALFIFYRDRYLAYLQRPQPPAVAEQSRL